MPEQLSDLVRLRRQLHRRPELGFLEIETAAAVITRLRPVADTLSFGRAVCDLTAVDGGPSPEERYAAVRRAEGRGVVPELLDELGTGATGVVATIRGSRPGPVIGIRFDLDALPIQESAEATHRPQRLGFASEIAGQMHACAHDGHVAIGLELGRRLADRAFAGQVRLIFQPAEEGVRGAAPMLATGVGDGIDIMLGLHLGIDLPVGVVATSAAGLLATEKVQARFLGRASHAALAPQQGRSAALGAAAAVLALHTLPQYAGAQTRVNVGTIIAGTAPNIVPESAEICFELRADSEEAFVWLRERADRVIAGSAATYGLEASQATIGRATTVTCDPALAGMLSQLARDVPGVRQVHDTAPMSASDDVSLFLREAQRQGGQATLILVGASSPAAHHSSGFDIDERCLEIGVGVLESFIRSRSAEPGRLGGSE